MVNFEKIKSLLGKKLKLLTKTGRRVETDQELVERVLKDLEENHNHSWYEEIYNRNKDNLEDIALIYRGNKITYGQMFEQMKIYAKSLKSVGIGKNSEIPVCMSNTPELVYLLGAASMIGAKLNIFADDFDPEYIKEIIDQCDSKIIFVEDNKYKTLGKIIEKTNVEKIILSSLTNSLPNGINPYQRFDNVHGLMKNTVEFYRNQNSKILSISDFCGLGLNYSGSISEKCTLDDEFLITYSSGSTHSSHPKAIVHANRSLITIGRCHDPEVQKTTSMKNFTIQAHIPTHSNTDIIASISDALMQGAKLALEPIYDKDFFISSLQINKPTYVVATRSFWINMTKEVLYNPKYKNLKMPELLLAFAVGEPFEKNEEKFVNKGLRKIRAGQNFTHLPISPVTMSVAGGDCEHGGIFWILFRSLQSKSPKYISKSTPPGLRPFQMVDVAVLDEDGKRCKPYELGRLVANSPCNMKCYKNNEEATKKFFIRDAEGKIWGDCSVYGYIDENNAVYMKGRIPECKEEVPTFLMADSILKDTRNILSCEVVSVETENQNSPVYVAHIELQPDKPDSLFKQVMVAADNRCSEDLGDDITSRIFYRFHDTEESYPLTGCGKRNFHALKEEGLTSKCIKPVFHNGEIEFQTPDEYLSKSQNKEYKRK